MAQNLLLRLRNTARLVVPCSALVLGGCFSDPEVVEAGETTAAGSTGLVPTGSGGPAESGSTQPDPSESTSGGAITDPGSSGDSTGQTTVSDTTAGGGSSGSTTGPVVVCEPFFDDFDDGPSRDWTYTQPQNTALEGGAMVLSVTAASDDGVNKLELVGGWSGLDGASVTVEFGQVPSQPGVIQMIRFTSTDGSPDLVAFRVHELPGGTELQVWHAVNNADFQEPIAVAFDSSAHRWLRVREEGDRLFFETSSDGVAFSEFYDMDDIFDLTGAAIGIAATNYLPVIEPEAVSFESFELTECAE